MPNLTRRTFLCAGLGALPALASCSLPGHRPDPPPTAIPRPTPTATATPASIVVPNRTPSPTARLRGTPVATPIPELQGAGELLYISQDRDDPGLVLADAAGARRRIVVPGDYGRVAWSPDGGRIAVTNPYNSPAVRVELYDPAGRVLQRAALEGRIIEGPIWSSFGDVVLVSVTVPLERDPHGRGIRHWLIGEGAGRSSGQDGLSELDLGGSLIVGDWSATGRLAVTVIRGQSPRLADAEVWTVDTNGADARRLVSGHYDPAGWSPDGLTLYARGDFRPALLAGENQYTALTSLFAISERDGLIRRITGLAEMTAQLAARGAAPPRPLQGILAAAPAPTGGQIALWCALDSPAAGSRGAPVTLVVVIVDERGGLRWWDGVSGPVQATIQHAWSPTGTRLAYVSGEQSGFATLHLVTPATGDAFTMELAGLSAPQWSPPQWSPGGRWLAVVAQQGVTIIDAQPPNRTWLLAADGLSSTWRPRGR